MQLKGTWYNELGSEMILTTVQAGRIEGTYETFVSECAKGKYTLVGRTDTDNDAAENIGFVVSWENENGSCDSVTTWSGEMSPTGTTLSAATMTVSAAIAMTGLKLRPVSA